MPIPPLMKAEMCTSDGHQMISITFSCKCFSFQYVLPFIIVTTYTICDNIVRFQLAHIATRHSTSFEMNDIFTCEVYLIFNLQPVTKVMDFRFTNKNCFTITSMIVCPCDVGRYLRVDVSLSSLYISFLLLFFLFPISD